jgi:glycerol-3-phosphate acyltransferase PlsX
VRIALDAMGTDKAPAAEVEGAVRALRELDPEIEIVLVGHRDAVEAEVAKHADVPAGRLHVHHAGDRVLPSDPSATVLRRKPDSSIAVGIGLHKAGEVDAFISAGSTGAVMAASLFALRPLPGVERPSVATFLPTAGEPTLLLDAGTNVDCKPRHLVQFAHLGHVYVKDILGVEEPRIGLLNIGEEPEKGDERSVETHALLATDDRLNFVGNVEGREIVRGVCDVLVADGFAGNVLLKFYESVALFIIGLMEKEVRRSEMEMDLRDVFRTLDYTEYGGAPLLGVNGVSIICHGGSTPKAIRNAVRVAAQAVRTDMVDDMARELSELSESRRATSESGESPSPSSNGGFA